MPSRRRSEHGAGEHVTWRVGRPSGLTGDLARLDRNKRALVGLDVVHQLDEIRPWIAFDVELDTPFHRLQIRAMSWTSVVVMWRASARGWTVIPGAPASMHTLYRFEHRRHGAAARVPEGCDLVDVDRKLG